WRGGPRRGASLGEGRGAGGGGWGRGGALWRAGTVGGAPPSHRFAFFGQVVAEEVLSQPIRPRVERPPLVDARHALDEGAQARAVVEHEGVDGDTSPSDALDLAQGLLCGAHADPTEGQRPLAVEAAA